MMRRTLPNSLDAGAMTHSRLFRISLFMMVINPFVRVSMLLPQLLIFFETKFRRSFPEAVTTQVEVVTSDDRTVGATSLTGSGAFAEFSFFFQLLFSHAISSSRRFQLPMSAL